MKQDMSKTCNFGYQAMWIKRDSGEISEKNSCNGIMNIVHIVFI